MSCPLGPALEGGDLTLDTFNQSEASSVRRSPCFDGRRTIRHICNLHIFVDDSRYPFDYGGL